MNVWQIKTMGIEVERHIDASPERIFDAWLDPGCKGSPWNGVNKAILQPVVDGLFYRMHESEPGGYELAHYGRFLTIERPGLIRYTWVSQHTRGLESVVTMSLSARGAATRVLIRHENLPDDAKGRMHEDGWQYYLAQLDEELVAA
jgi:uncharacterized protein YndB with AHSA1/START domain